MPDNVVTACVPQNIRSDLGLRGLLAELSLNSLPPPPFLQMSNGCSLEVPVHLEAHLAAHNRNV